jgi:hypothetical protein
MSTAAACNKGDEAMLNAGLRLTFLVLATASLPHLAFSQEKVVEKSVTVAAGEAKQIGVFGRVTPQCDNGKVKVRLAKQAANGTVTARPGKLKRGAVQKCPELTPDVAAIFYQAKAGFAGQDTATIEIETDDGKLERHEYSITVE